MTDLEVGAAIEKMNFLALLINAILGMLCINAMAIENKLTRHITADHLTKDFYGLFKMKMGQFKGGNLPNALNQLKEKYRKLSR